MRETLYTVSDLDELDGNFELDQGRLVPMSPAKTPHSGLRSRFDTKIRTFVEEQDLGEVFVELGCFIERDPDTLRGPDVSFVSWDRLEASGYTGADDDRWQEGPPDLAVEVTSDLDERVKILRRIRQVMAAGCPLVWHVMIPERTVTVYAAGQPKRVLRPGDVLDGGVVLPGFHWDVADIFQRRRRRKR